MSEENQKMFESGLIDSLRIRVKRDKVKIIDKTLISTYVKYYPSLDLIDEEVRSATPFVHLDKGITYRIYVKAFIDKSKQAQEYVVFQISAKMLKERYFEGITKENIKYILEDINALNVVQIDINALLDGLVSDIDICINQLVDLKSYNTAIALMLRYPRNSKKPLLKPYGSDSPECTNRGLDFNKREKATNTAPYCKIYHKGFELLSKSLPFYDAYLKPLKDKFLKNLVRYEFTIKAHKHKEYLINKGFNADFKTLGDLLNTPQEDLTKIAKTGLKMYLEEHKESRVSKDSSPTDIMIQYYIENLINLGFDTEKLLGFTHLIDDASSRSRTKTKAKKLINEFTSVDDNINAKLKANDKAKTMLKGFGF